MIVGAARAGRQGTRWRDKRDKVCHWHRSDPRARVEACPIPAPAPRVSSRSRVRSVAELGSGSSRLVGVQEHPGYEISVRGCDW